MKTKIYRVRALDIAKVERLMLQTAITCFAVGVALACIIVSIIFCVVMRRQETTYQKTIADYTTKIATMEGAYASQQEKSSEELEKTVTQYEERHQTYIDQIETLNYKIGDLEAQVLRLTTEQAVDFEQLREYAYIFTDTPKGSGLTLDHIKWSWECSKTWNVNPQLMWAIYEVETDLDPRKDNSESSARGLGQVLASTGESIWEDVLGHGPGSYTHEMAYDPYVNIEITTCLLGRNLANGTLEDAIWLYGDRTESYYGQVMRAAKDHGVTITESNARYTV